VFEINYLKLGGQTCWKRGIQSLELQRECDKIIELVDIEDFTRFYGIQDRVLGVVPKACCLRPSMGNKMLGWAR